MEVTDVRLRRITTEGRMKAIASITFDHGFVIHDIRVIEGNTGLFVAMPSKRTANGEFRDIVHPINMQIRNMIQDSILSEYYKIEEVEVAYKEAGASL